MIIDVFLVLIALLGLWMGWALRIYVDGHRLMIVILFSALTWILFPWFISFVNHSSVDIPIGIYYIFGFVLAGLIFLCFFLLLRNKKKPKRTGRLTGSITLAAVAVFSMIIVLRSMALNGWIDLGDSLTFSFLSEWFFKQLLN